MIEKEQFINQSYQYVLNKQRPHIFDQHKLKYKKKTFDDIYINPFLKQLSFLVDDQYRQCNCTNQMKQCPKLKYFLKEQIKDQAKIIFQGLRQKCTFGTVTNYLPIIQNEVLQPHLQKLLSIIQTEHIQALVQILRHAKTDYTTFWIYGLFCLNFPSYQTIKKNIENIVEQKSLDINLQLISMGQTSKLKKTYARKLIDIFPSKFIIIVNLLCKTPRSDMIIQKLIVGYFIKGREREQIEVIKAAVEM